LEHHLQSLLVTLAEAKARANKTSTVQASPMIIAYNPQNIFNVHATELIPTQLLATSSLALLFD
jgi:hypothetical protein